MSIIDWLLINADGFLFWVLTLLATLASGALLKLIGAGAARDMVRRALTEVGDAVLAVAKTYVEAIKLASADGKLTPEEKAEARAKALKVAKANIGKDGLARLAKILGADVDLDNWLITKIESAVAAKAPAIAPASATVRVGEIEAKATAEGPASVPQ